MTEYHRTGEITSLLGLNKEKSLATICTRYAFFFNSYTHWLFLRLLDFSDRGSFLIQLIWYTVGRIASIQWG